MDLPSYVPAECIKGPAGSTHYQLVSAAMDINFESGAYTSEQNSTQIQPIGSTQTTATQLTQNLPEASVNPLFLIFGVSFYREINGEFYELKNGAFNALQIIGVSGTP